MLKSVGYLSSYKINIIKHKFMAQQGPLLQSWFNFIPSMDKKSHIQSSALSIYVFIPKFQKLHQ